MTRPQEEVISNLKSLIERCQAFVSDLKEEVYRLDQAEEEEAASPEEIGTETEGAPD